MNLINESNQQLVSDFINRYKHTYVSENQYELVGLNDHLHFFNQLSQPFDQEDKVVFEAVVHMQISLQVHDLVEFQFNPESLPTETERSNQMNALVGDYHSAWFYKLLASNEKLDALNHFVQPVKRINQIKMELLHNDRLTNEEILNYIEGIYMGLYDAYAVYYSVEDYEKLRQQIVQRFLYHQKPFWLNHILDDQKVNDYWKEAAYKSKTD